MRIIKLSADFYNRYGSKPEILQKTDRPYSCLAMSVDGITYAIPLRHHIKHPYCFHTIGVAGIDFTKAIPLLENNFASDEDVRIDSKEWSILKRHEQDIYNSFKKYLFRYRKAKRHPDQPQNQNILKYSSLQYFDV